MTVTLSLDTERGAGGGTTIMLGLDTEIIMEICKAPTLRLKALNKHWTMKEGKNTTITLGLDTERGQKTQQSHWAWILKEGKKHNNHTGLGY